MKNTYKTFLVLLAVVVLGFFAAWFGRQPSPSSSSAPVPVFVEHVDVDGQIYGATHEHARSSKWPAVRDAYLKTHPKCAYKGCNRVPLEVHHIKPYHLYPELELEPSNFITLCRDEVANHHLYGGHDGDFRGSNPNIREDAKNGKYPEKGGKLQKKHAEWLRSHPR